MPSPLAVDVQGNELLSFEPGSESDLERVDPTIPLPLALVVGRHGGDIPLIFNRSRQEWELPGGMLDPGETPRQAAAREFVEGR
jgi:8-oxo-dGTP diphosphatase